MKPKSARLIFIIALLLVFSASGEKLVETVAPIIKLHVLPSADAESQEFATKGQQFIVDGESGSWYRIHNKNNNIAWISKDAVKVLQSSEPEPVQTASTSDKKPVTAQGQPKQNPAESTARAAQTAAQAATQAAAQAEAQAKAKAQAIAGEQQRQALAQKELQKKALAAATEQPAAGVPLEGTAGQERDAKKAAAALAKRRTWYSHFSPFGRTESGISDSFFQVSGSRTAIYALASTGAKVLFTAEKGDFFPLVEENASWCKVTLKDTTGWVELNKGIIVSAPSTGIGQERTLILIVLITLIVVAVLLSFLRYKARIRKRKAAAQGSATSALEGDIADSNLPEILQFIDMGKKTGCLQIENESPLGVLYFAQGRVVHAAAANSVAGRDAINAILGLKAGTFKFILDKQPKARTLDLSTLEVLMEWSKAEDEAHRG